MKKQISCLAVIMITAFFIGYVVYKENNKMELSNEVRSIFISYVEYLKYFQGQSTETIQKEIDQMVECAKEYHFNRIYLQVRPFSDSIYKSNIFPFSHTISGIQGEDINFDILSYFIDTAHSNQIELHAWINPYRISNNTDISFLSEDNPAYHWLNTNHVKIIDNKGIFYNPASKEVEQLIIDGVEEIVANYKVDGILLDDYFYPDDDTIDLENYKEVENMISLADFRLSKINELISKIYKTIKEIDYDVLFGVSPDGNIENNYNKHYADIKKWLSEDGYIDYIMPQLYYGFKHDTKPFIQVLNEWNDLIQNDCELIVALSIYKAGELDLYAGTAQNEWQENNNIIKKQIQVSRNLAFYNGYSIFRYDFFEDEAKNVNLQQEIVNYQELFKKNNFVYFGY